MAFETGIPNNHTDLLNKLAVWSQFIGWTINKQIANELYLYSNGISGTENLYFSFRADIAGTYPHIKIIGNTGYDGGLAWNNQPGKAVCQGGTIADFNIMPLINSPMSGYWFFGDKDYISVVCEVASGWFTHMHFGKIERAYPFTGGQCFGASRQYMATIFVGNNWAYKYDYVDANWMQECIYIQGHFGGNLVRVGNNWQELANYDYDGGIAQYKAKSNYTYSGSAPFGYNQKPENFRNTFNQLLVIHPSYLAGYRISDGLYSPLGYFKNVYILAKLGTDVLPKASLFYGTDEYICFPAQNVTSDGYGLAIKKVI